MSAHGKYEVVCAPGVTGAANCLVALHRGHAGFNKLVALRPLNAELARSEQVEPGLLAAAKVVADFDHPGIVRLHALEVIAGTLHAASEFIPGVTLFELGQAAAAQGKLVPLGLLLAVARQVAAALAYAHDFIDPFGRTSPVVHGNVSDRCVVLGLDGRIKLGDFALRGVGEHAPDVRADMVALATMLRAYAKSPESSPELEALLDGLLQPNKERRPASMAELQGALVSVATPVSFFAAQCAEFVQQLFPQARDELCALVAAAERAAEAPSAQGVSAKDDPTNPLVPMGELVRAAAIFEAPTGETEIPQEAAVDSETQIFTPSSPRSISEVPTGKPAAARLDSKTVVSAAPQARPRPGPPVPDAAADAVMEPTTDETAIFADLEAGSPRRAGDLELLDTGKMAALPEIPQRREALRAPRRWVLFVVAAVCAIALAGVLLA